MSESLQPSIQTLRQVVEAFWESYPPFWRTIRSHIRNVAVDQFAISVEQFHILRHVRKGHGSVSELAQIQQISRPAISQAVDILVNKGLITRTQSSQDRRCVRLDLTSAGNDLLDAIFNHTRQWMMQVLAALDESELQNLLRSMDALKKILSGDLHDS
jgi:DNA-binding MarR family transcriptional regulator